MDTRLLGREVKYSSHVMDGGAPWLSSINFLCETDATISFRHGLAHFGELDPDHVVRLKRMASGHVGLALHDDGSRHERYPLNGREVSVVMREIADSTSK